MGRIVELFAGVITTLFCCGVPVVFIMGLYNVEFTRVLLEAVLIAVIFVKFDGLDGESPAKLNPM